MILITYGRSFHGRNYIDLKTILLKPVVFGCRKCLKIP